MVLQILIKLSANLYLFKGRVLNFHVITTTKWTILSLPRV